jgi:hypothetical protein
MLKQRISLHKISGTTKDRYAGDLSLDGMIQQTQQGNRWYFHMRFQGSQKASSLRTLYSMEWYNRIDVESKGITIQEFRYLRGQNERAPGGLYRLEGGRRRRLRSGNKLLGQGFTDAKTRCQLGKGLTA